MAETSVTVFLLRMEERSVTRADEDRAYPLRARHAGPCSLACDDLARACLPKRIMTVLEEAGGDSWWS